MDLILVQNLAIAIGLGLLVGFERQMARSRVAGVRTFTLITVLGVMTGTAAGAQGQWLVVAGLLAIAALLVTGNLMAQRQDANVDPGMTTEVAALVMFTVGAALAASMRVIPVVVAGSVSLLLHWKEPLHALVSRIGESDYRAVTRLTLIGLVILPILPNRTYGPYGVINPFQIWLMVVLIVGISLAGYVAWRVFGARMGTLLGGALGGLISSTAATVGYARATRHSPEDANGAAVMVLIASTVVFARVLFEIAVVAPGVLRELAPPLALMLLIMLAISAVTWTRTRRTFGQTGDEEPPSDLRAAIVFGLLYAAVLLGVAFAREHAGTAGLYTVAALSGLTDMDAITLSTAQLVRTATLDGQTGWRLILIGAMANLVFKGAAVAVLGHPRLTRRIISLFGLAIIGGTAILFLWPG